MLKTAPLLLAILLSAPAWAKVEPEIVYEYYPVTPEAGRSLHYQLHADSPRKLAGGAVAAGWTKSPINFRYRLRRTTVGLCRIKTLEVSCRCEITLPELKSDAPALKSDFNAYLVLLKDHELTHCRISTGHAERFREAAEALGEAPCESLKGAIDKAYEEMLKARNAEQDRFDHQTQLGGFLSRKGAILLGGANKPRPELNVGPLGNLPEPEPPPPETWTAERDANGVWRIEISEPAAGAVYKDKDGVWRNY